MRRPENRDEASLLQWDTERNRKREDKWIAWKKMAAKRKLEG